MQLRQVRRERLGDEVIEGLNDPVGLLMREPERGADGRDDRRSRDRREQVADEIRLFRAALRRSFSDCQRLAQHTQAEAASTSSGIRDSQPGHRRLDLGFVGHDVSRRVNPVLGRLDARLDVGVLGEQVEEVRPLSSSSGFCRRTRTTTSRSRSS